MTQIKEKSNSLIYITEESKDNINNIKTKDSMEEINEMNLTDNFNNNTNIKLSELTKIKMNRDKKIFEKLKLDLDFNKINKNDINNFEINKKMLINKVNDNDLKEKDKDKYSPKNIKLLKVLIEDSYCNYNFTENTFIIFESINNILQLIYSKKNKSIKSIICYNLINNEKICEIKNAHNKNYINFRHYLDKNNKNDFIISVSTEDNNIKLWNFKNFNCILDLKNINKTGRILSACFLNDNNQTYIITSNYNMDNPGEKEKIKVLDLKGNKKGEINDSNEDVYFIDIYYDNERSKKYIITGNEKYLKSYDYNENRLYKIYDDTTIISNKKMFHHSIIINDKEKKVKLYESNMFGVISIWDFYSGELLKKLFSQNDIDFFNFTYVICLWDNKNNFVGCDVNILKLISVENNNITEISNNNRYGYEGCLKIIFHPNYGKCLITQNDQGSIRLFGINN